MSSIVTQIGGHHQIKEEQARESHVSSAHSNSLLKGLKEMWARQELCDVRLQIGRETYLVHRNVLSACSSYFHAMFTGGLSEEGKDIIHIQEVQPEIFTSLLDFIYSGEIAVTTDNCQDLLSAADMFGLHDVIEVCCDFLKQQLHVSNCIGIYMFAECHSCGDLETSSLNYIHSHFLDVTQHEEFLSLPKESVAKLLDSENIHVDNEFQIFNSAMNWILADPRSRSKDIFDVMAPIRFPVISHAQLDQYISQESLNISLKVALRKILQDFNIGSFSRLSLCSKEKKSKTHLYQPRRNMRKSVFMIGGYNRQKGARWTDSMSLAIVEKLDIFKQQWKLVPSLRHPRSSMGVTVLNGLIYCVGGESDSLMYDTAEVYDPVCNKWTVIPSMNFPRCGFGLCAVGEFIYALGGWVASEMGCKIERYDPHSNYWCIWDTVNTLRFNMGVVEYKDIIFVVGGNGELSSDEKTVESYDPINKTWRRLANMQKARSFVAVAALDDHIYAVGGWNEHSGALSIVEQYSPDKDCWTTLHPMPTARAAASIAAVNGLLYVIGGRTTCDQFTAPETLDIVEVYDPQLDCWMELNPMPTGRCEAGIAVI